MGVLFSCCHSPFRALPWVSPPVSLRFEEQIEQRLFAYLPEHIGLSLDEQIALGFLGVPFGYDREKRCVVPGGDSNSGGKKMEENGVRVVPLDPEY